MHSAPLDTNTPLMLSDAPERTLDFFPSTLVFVVIVLFFVFQCPHCRPHSLVPLLSSVLMKQSRVFLLSMERTGLERAGDVPSEGTSRIR